MVGALGLLHRLMPVWEQDAKLLLRPWALMEQRALLGVHLVLWLLAIVWLLGGWSIGPEHKDVSCKWQEKLTAIPAGAAFAAFFRLGIRGG